MLLPSFVPKPVCGATRFFGCFEPVRKGCCSADARPIFFRKWVIVLQAHRGMSHLKRVTARYLCCGGNLFLRYADLMLRGKSRFCSFAFAKSSGALIENFDLSQNLAFPEKFRSI